jgi:hypothetical protein
MIKRLILMKARHLTASTFGVHRTRVDAADGTCICQTGGWNVGGSWQDGMTADGGDFTAFFTTSKETTTN